MVQNFNNASPKERKISARRNVNAGDLNGVTVDSNVYKGVFSVKGTRVDAYFPGYGKDSTSSMQNRADLDIQNSGGSASDGDLRWELYASEDRENLIAKSNTFRTEALRSSVAAELADKITMPEQSPGAGQDRELVLAMKADDGSDGDTISSSNSNSEQGLPYSRVATA
jgi:hypothetical protein